MAHLLIQPLSQTDEGETAECSIKQPKKMFKKKGKKSGLYLQIDTVTKLQDKLKATHQEFPIPLKSFLITQQTISMSWDLPCQMRSFSTHWHFVFYFPCFSVDVL